MKAEKKPQAPVVHVVHDIVLTLSPAEAKALFWIAEHFDADDADDKYHAGTDEDRFDVTLHRALLDLGVHREG